MSRHNAIEKAVRKERLSAIRRCRHCDPCGWQLGWDHTPIDPVVRCTHGATTSPSGRRISTLNQDSNLFSEPIQRSDDTEE